MYSTNTLNYNPTILHIRLTDGQPAGNPAVYGQNQIFLLYIYASNHTSDQCTKCAIMLRVKNIHTVFIVDEIDHIMSYLPPLCRNGCHSHRLSTYLIIYGMQKAY